jgi:hypothetical protein
MSFKVAKDPEKLTFVRRQVVIHLRGQSHDASPAETEIPCRPVLNRQENLDKLRQSLGPKSSPPVNLMPRPTLSTSISDSSTSYGSFKSIFSKSESCTSSMSSLTTNGSTEVMMGISHTKYEFITIGEILT